VGVGVTTGVGDSVVRPIPADLVEEFPLHLLRFHGCGLGKVLDPQSTRAVLAVRLASLCQGASGVRWELLELVRDLFNFDALPRIPEEGSVGASGDLTPLSYLAAVLVGEREVFFEGTMRPTSEVLCKLGLEPLRLLPKEALAIMNGTAVMTALADGARFALAAHPDQAATAMDAALANWCRRLRVWPAVKFCPLYSWSPNAVPDELKTCISTLALLRPAVPVSLTVMDTTDDPLAAIELGAGVAEDVQDSPELDPRML